MNPIKPLKPFLSLILLLNFTGTVLARPTAQTSPSPQPTAAAKPAAKPEAQPSTPPADTDAAPSAEPSATPASDAGKSTRPPSSKSTSKSGKRHKDDNEELKPLPSASPRQDDEKNPWVAAGFSLLLPGSGQMYVEERVWPEILITAGIGLAVAAFVVFDQLRAGSIKERVISGLTVRRADAQWDALTLLMQITVPSLWLWNAGDAFHRAEKFGEKVTGELDSHANAYIIEENLVSVTLWQF